MKTKRIVAFFLSATMLILPGCMNKKEPKDLAVVISSMFDKVDDGNYAVTIEIMKFSGSSKGSSGQVSNIVETDEGPSVREATFNSFTIVENSNYGGHNQVRFFSERFAQDEENMAQVFDFNFRDHLTDETADVIVVKGAEPLKIYSAAIGESSTLGGFIEAHEKNELVSGSKTVYRTSLNFIKDYYTEGKEPVAGIVELEEYDDLAAASEPNSNGSETAAQAQKVLKPNLEGLAVFRGMKLVGFLDGQGTRAYNFITNNIKTSVISVPFDDNMAVLEAESASCKIDAKIIDGKAHIDVAAKVKLGIITYGGTSDLQEASVKKGLEQAFNRQMQAEFLSAIQQAQGLMSDIFGFGQQIRIKDPDIWRSIRDRWNELFAGAEVEVSVDAVIRTTGQTKYSIQSEKTE